MDLAFGKGLSVKSMGNVDFSYNSGIASYYGLHKEMSSDMPEQID